MNMRAILWLHLFNISPTKTLDFNCIAYEEMNKRTKGNTESSSFIYTLPCIKKAPDCPVWGSNSRPSDYETDALPNCANEACAGTRVSGEALASRSSAIRGSSNSTAQPLAITSGWPSGLRRCVQVAVSPGGVGSNPTSDKPNLWLRAQARVFNPLASLPTNAWMLTKHCVPVHARIDQTLQ